MLGCGWSLGRGCRPEHVASAGGLGFLAAWRPVSGRTVLRERARGKPRPRLSPSLRGRAESSATVCSPGRSHRAVPSTGRGGRPRFSSGAYRVREFAVCCLKTTIQPLLCGHQGCRRGPVPQTGMGCCDCPGLGQTSRPGGQCACSEEGQRLYMAARLERLPREPEIPPKKGGWEGKTTYVLSRQQINKQTLRCVLTQDDQCSAGSGPDAVRVTSGGMEPRAD